MRNKFKVGDNVIITGKLYNGKKGRIVSGYDKDEGKWEYWVKLEEYFTNRGFNSEEMQLIENEATVDSVQTFITKDSNPKDAIGIKKVPFSTVPSQVVAELGLGMLEGALKYGRHNYRVIGVRASVYYDAAMRHLTAYWEGEDIDPESGLPHIVKAMSSLVVLRDAQIQDKVTDDRPPNNPTGWVGKLNDKAKEIIEKFPNPRKPYTEKNHE